MTRAFTLALPVAALLAACQANDDTTADEPVAEATTAEGATAEPATARLALASLQLADGGSAGTAELTEANGQLTVSVALTGLAQGAHGLHLHMVGKCEAPAFESAGGHLNPAGRQHGTENPAGSHLGDLPNVTADASGAGSASAAVAGSRDEVLAQLFDADGTAIVVHAGPDDYRTDPSGNSGDRVACGVLTRS